MRAARFLPAVALTQETGEADRRPQFPAATAVALGGRDGLAEALLSLGCMVVRLGEEQFPPEPVQLGLVEAVAVLLDRRQCLIERTLGLCELTGLSAGVSEDAEVGRARISAPVARNARYPS